MSLLDPVDPIEECTRLAHALKIEREWVASLTRDNGLLLLAADATKAGKLAVSQAGRIEHLERENAALRRDVYQCPPTSENDYEGFKWSDACEELERENAALRNEIARLNNQTNWVCKCGGTDCEGQRENAALREALASAENGLRHGLMMEPVDPFQRGKVISWALDTVRAALKKEAQP